MKAVGWDLLVSESGASHFLISFEAAFDYEQVAKRIAISTLTKE